MSYHLDSRNENVRLQFNNLDIDSPTTFSDTVDFTGSPMVIGTTWPRTFIVELGHGAVGAGVELPTVTWASFFIRQDTFLSLTPTLNRLNYFTFDGVTGLFTFVEAGIYTIDCLFLTDHVYASDNTIYYGKIYLQQGGVGPDNPIAGAGLTGSGDFAGAELAQFSVSKTTYVAAGSIMHLFFETTTPLGLSMMVGITKLR